MQQPSGAFRSLPEVPRRYQGGTQGSVPVPANAVCAQMPSFLASSSARPAAALRSSEPSCQARGHRSGETATARRMPPAKPRPPGPVGRRALPSFVLRFAARSAFNTRRKFRGQRSRAFIDCCANRGRQLPNILSCGKSGRISGRLSRSRTNCRENVREWQATSLSVAVQEANEK